MSSRGLPDSPGYLLAARPSAIPLQAFSRHDERTAGAQSPRTPMLHRVVPAGMGVQSLTTKQKFELSVHSRFSLGAYSGALLSAAVGQIADGRPHYGTDKAAFGERLGAASLRQASDSFFSYGLYAVLTREDPHYYVMGRGERVGKRAVYAASRVVVTTLAFFSNVGTSAATLELHEFLPDVMRLVLRQH